MADDTDQAEKTEEPTERKLQKALEKGDVAKSQEVTSWFMVAGATLLMAIFAPAMAEDLTKRLAIFLQQAHQYSIGGTGLQRLFADTYWSVVAVIFLPMGLLILMGIAGNMVQHRMVWSLEPVKPKLSKISPLSGIKRLFSRESLLNFVKGLLKLGLVATLMVAIVWPQSRMLESLIQQDLGAILPTVWRMALQLLGAVVAVLAIIAAIDFMFQRQKWWQKQRMTQREVKDEFKQQEGDPQVKAKVRALRQERARKRMMAAVPEATVVVTNPTHFAVALKYDDSHPAPVVVAKGVDNLALKIREAARDHDVAIVENPPLARALYAGVDIDEMIPETHFKAVAQIISFVTRRRSRGRSAALNG